MTYDGVIEKPELDELYHYGVQGMKWGVRRYQNVNGSLTSAGRKRYGYNLDLTDTSRRNIAKIRLGEARRRLDYAKLHKSGDTRKADLQGRVRSAKRALRNAKKYDKGAKLAGKGQTIYGNKSKVVLTALAASGANKVFNQYLNKRVFDLTASGKFTSKHRLVVDLSRNVAGLTLGALTTGYALKKMKDNSDLRAYNRSRWDGSKTIKAVGSQEYADRKKKSK